MPIMEGKSGRTKFLNRVALNRDICRCYYYHSLEVIRMCSYSEPRNPIFSVSVSSSLMLCRDLSPLFNFLSSD